MGGKDRETWCDLFISLALSQLHAGITDHCSMSEEVKLRKNDATCVISLAMHVGITDHYSMNEEVKLKGNGVTSVISLALSQMHTQITDHYSMNEEES